MQKFKSKPYKAYYYIRHKQRIKNKEKYQDMLGYLQHDLNIAKDDDNLIDGSMVFETVDD